MSKRELSAGLTRDVQNINAASFSDKVKMIPLEKVLPNERNFYRIDGDEVEILAEDILSQGLKHNLVVTENGDGTYTLISGHKRREAIRRLVERAGYTSLLPCFVADYKDEDEEMQALIMLNVTNRKLTDSELKNGYKALKVIFEEKKQSGEVSGRIRALIAKELGVSDSQLKKIDNINNNAIDDIISAVHDDEMSINKADKLAKLSHEEQEDFIEDMGISTHENGDEIGKKKAGTNTRKQEKFTAKSITKAMLNLDYPQERIDEILAELRENKEGE